MASSKLLVKIQDPLADRGQVLQTVKLLSGAHFSRVQLSRGKQIVKVHLSPGVEEEAIFSKESVKASKFYIFFKC